MVDFTSDQQGGSEGFSFYRKSVSSSAVAVEFAYKTLGSFAWIVPVGVVCRVFKQCSGSGSGREFSCLDTVEQPGCMQYVRNCKYLHVYSWENSECCSEKKSHTKSFELYRRGQVHPKFSDYVECRNCLCLSHSRR